MLKTQIPAVAARYFEALDVSVHPDVSATFSSRAGWRPVIHPRPVSHGLLAQLAATGVTSVALHADGREPEFTITELIGTMGQLDAEKADGVPVSEGSAVVADREGVVAVLRALGVPVRDAAFYLESADREGHTVFIVEERSNFDHTRIEGWRYRLTHRPQIKGGGAGYELRVLAHDPRREA